LLDEIVRDGARAMLAAALQAEVAAYIDAHADKVDGNGYRLVVRNGYHVERGVLTAAGVVPCVAPRVNDRRVDAETGERGAAAVVLAWPVQQRLWPGVGAVPGVGPRVCRRPRSPGSPPCGKTTPRRSTSARWPFKLIESAQARWRAVNAPHLVALVRAGPRFEKGKLIERPDESTRRIKR